MMRHRKKGAWHYPTRNTLQFISKCVRTEYCAMWLLRHLRQNKIRLGLCLHVVHVLVKGNYISIRSETSATILKFVDKKMAIERGTEKYLQPISLLILFKIGAYNRLIDLKFQHITFSNHHHLTTIPNSNYLTNNMQLFRSLICIARYHSQFPLISDDKSSFKNFYKILHGLTMPQYEINL